MTSNEIRQSFFDFFKSKQHTIVPSASLLPQSPGLLFTNAGMNQFVPYFLGTEKATYSPPRAADTQKCIRAGGKHNDLDDVGYDTYHHTFFEMLGNWSFGDYFKPEAIQWAWELIVETWGFPAERLYATVYSPDKTAGDPSEFDQEAYDLWAKLFQSKNLDPAKHIVNGNVEDNFWKMGDTGPCGPCSELHVDLTPNGDTNGELVNKDSDLCIEIWNLVFIQYNAEADGTYRDLPAKHIDTGMGFERAASIYQGTNGFKDFSKKPTNYATDIFTPIFKKLEELSGKAYNDIYPESVDIDKSTLTPDMKEAVAFRVIADHIRTLSFSIADGIQPGNTGRNYVLRRILRRAVRYGRTLGFNGKTNFLTQLTDTLVDQMAHIFPEMKTRRQAIKETLTREEESFNRTLDRGLTIFETEAKTGSISGDFAFELYDTYGFPIDLTELICQERKLSLDIDGFNIRMEKARKLSQDSQKKTVVKALEISSNIKTEFTGYDEDSSQATILEIHQDGDNLLVITDRTPFYTEMGGQLGDTGILTPFKNDQFSDPIQVSSVLQIGQAYAHIVPTESALTIGDTVALTINSKRRRPIEAHHTATHLLHWALHEVVSTDATQQGSLVSTDRLRFDFSSGALTEEQIKALEDKVNEKIATASPVHYVEVPYTDVKNRKDIMQFFGDKYGDLVRVVQIGGNELGLNGYAMELCGGTHSSNTSEIGTFKIKSEGAIAAGVRRIEAVVGKAAQTYIGETLAQIREEITAANSKLTEANNALIKIETNILPTPPQPTEETIDAQTTYLETHKKTAANADKSLKKAQVAAAASMADEALVELLEQNTNIAEIFEGPANLLQELLNGLKKKQFTKAAFLIVDDGNRLHLGAYSGAEAQATGTKAGDLIKQLAPIAGGKGGGKPDQARGAAPARSKAEELKNTANKALS